MKFTKVLGIDIGGSGIKGAPVNTKDGVLLESRYRIATPDPSLPEKLLMLLKRSSCILSGTVPWGADSLLPYKMVL
jgi:predicted NBD/HSP70 family sugar kinase